MDTWIELARGPLFRIAATVMVLGLMYRLTVAVGQAFSAWRRAGDQRLPLAEIAAATGRWLMPVGALRSRPIFSSASVVFHISMLILPFFLAGHGVVLSFFLPEFWPTLSNAAADVLSLGAIASLLVLISGRLAVPTARRLTRPQDVLVLVILLLTFGAGFLAAHPLFSPFGARSLLLAHILLGNLVMVLIPTSKIAHCIIYPLTHFIFQLGWHFPASTGRHVAVALSKENEAI